MFGLRQRRQSTVTQRKSPFLRWVAGACALLVWALGLLAVTPDLHAALHTDAGHADHECAITLFAHGADHAAPVTVLITAPLERVVAVVRPDAPLLAESTVDWLQPGRGPPVR